MRDLLNALEIEPELPKPVVATLGVISIVLAIACWLLVRRAIEPGSAAEWSLTLLFLGAMSGYMTIFIALIKILIHLRGPSGQSST